MSYLNTSGPCDWFAFYTAFSFSLTHLLTHSFLIILLQYNFSAFIQNAFRCKYRDRLQPHVLFNTSWRSATDICRIC